jgi:CRP-like cAMP-binding protein
MTGQAVSDQLVPLLRQVGLFSRCTDYDLTIVARRAEVLEVASGDRIVTEGEMGSDLYLVLLGGAAAVTDGQVSVSFGPGDHFGELAALAPAPRTTDVVATDRTVLAVLGHDQVYSLLDVIPGVARKMLEGLADGFRRSLVSP